MILEVRTVGRKTPGDGRLEVSEATYRRLAMDGALMAHVGDAEATATLERMPCTCGRGHDGAHEHTFVRSGVFRHLAAGETCVIDLVAPGQLVVASPHPLS